MQCNEFALFLEQEPDGPLSDPVALHLDGCANCRRLWQDLEGIRTAGMDWASHDPAPPDRLWIALKTQLQAEGLIVAGDSTSGFQRPQAYPWFRDWFSLPLRPAFAGVSLSLLLLASILLRVQNNPSAQTSAGINLRADISGAGSLETDLNRTLDSDLQRVMASLPRKNSPLTTSLRQNLSIVDNLIAVCEKSVREQPHNPVAREYLYGAYEQKAVLLSAAVDHSTLEDR